MTILSSKWVIVLLVIVALLLVLFIVGKKSVKAEVTIEASPDEVWKVLTEINTVGEWNKVLIPIHGELEQGNTIKYEFYQDEKGKAAAINARVKELLPSQLINQTGGIPGVLTFNHKYIIEPDPMGCKVLIHEKYRGVMVPFWNPAPVEKAYERLLISLRDRMNELKE